MNKVKKHLGAIIVAIIFLIGVGLLAYPSFSNWWNDRHQSRAIATYEAAVADSDESENEQLLAQAEAYNERLATDRASGTMVLNNLTDDQKTEYNTYLDITGTGIMAYIKIPKIDVELPIYHGTDEAVLQIAVGHIEGTSLPIGGTGTHAVISGHRGLPSAELFTNIDALGEGDIFIITALGRKITYQVDQIVTVLPEDTSALAIDPDQDYCTLVTCTPYGINSHRLLVRGHRIDNLIDDDVKTIQVEIPERELSEYERIQQYLPYIMILAAGFFALALIIPGKKRDDQNSKTGDKNTHKRHRRQYVATDTVHDDDQLFDDNAQEQPAPTTESDKTTLQQDKPPAQTDTDDIEFYDKAAEICNKDE